MEKSLIEFDIKKFNFYTIISILCIIAGLLLWISWGLQYNVWYDIGIYSITIVFLIAGIVGFILSLMLDKDESD